MNNKYQNLIDEIINSKERILIDIDDTTVNLTPLLAKTLNERHITNLEVSDIVLYDIELIKPLREKGVTEADILSDIRYMGNKEEFLHLPLIDGFMELYKMITNNFKNLERIYFVTSRSADFYDNPREKTILTLENNDIPFLERNLILKDNKHDFAIENNVKFVFDDSLNIAKQFLTNNYDGKLIINNTPFNSINEKDATLLEDEVLNKKKKLVDLTNNNRILRTSGYNGLLSEYRHN